MITDRAILLPSIGDPFLLNLWFKQSYPNFKDEIDHVYMVLDCNHSNDDKGAKGLRQTKNYIFNKYNSFPGVSVEFSKLEGIGGPLTEIFDICKHNYFGIIQEDAFVYKRGEVARYFKMIEDDIVDIVGTPMYCYTGALNEIMDKVTGYREPYLNHLGYAFWQNFFFTTLKNMYQTDMKLLPETWLKGAYVDYLKTKMPCDMSLDIMAGVSFQLRALKKRIYYVAQELSTKDDCFYPLDVNFWQHVTTLSGIFPFMVNEVWDNECDDAFKVEIERRVAWWVFALADFPANEIPTIQPFYNLYDETIHKIVVNYKLDITNINKRVSIIKRLFDI